jgi:hypothetical protein
MLSSVASAAAEDDGAFLTSTNMALAASSGISINSQNNVPSQPTYQPWM